MTALPGWPYRVLMLEHRDDDDSGDYLVISVDKPLREVRGATVALAQAAFVAQWRHPEPLRFPEDMGPTPAECEHLMRFATLRVSQPPFMYYVLDEDARGRAFYALFDARAGALD